MKREHKIKVIINTLLLVYFLTIFVSIMLPEIGFFSNHMNETRYMLKGIASIYPSDEPGKFAEPDLDNSKIYSISPDKIPSVMEYSSYDTLYFKGKFIGEIPVNQTVLFRLDNVAMKLLVNGKEIFSHTENDKVVSFTRSPSVGYVTFVSPGIKSTDLIEIYLANYYKFNSNNVFSAFFQDIYKNSPYFLSNRSSKLELLENLVDYSLAFIGVFILLLYLVLYSKGNKQSFLFYLGVFIISTGLKLVGKHSETLLFFPFPTTLAFSDIVLKYVSVIAIAGYLNTIPLLTSSRGTNVISWILKAAFAFSLGFMYFSENNEYDFILFYCEQLLLVLAFVIVLFFAWWKNRKSLTSSSKTVLIGSLLYAVGFALQSGRSGTYFQDNLSLETSGFIVFLFAHILLFKQYIVGSVSARAQSRHMEDLAYRDALTRTGNRQAWTEKNRRMNEKFITGDVFGIAMFDLNNLKVVNDEFGHAKGDEYIQTAAEIICKNFKNSPVYRIGGDEFVAVLNSTDCEKAEALREKLEMDCYVYYCSHPENKDFSIASGYAVVDYKKDTSFQAVFKRADADMYVHKKLMKERDLYERR